MSNSIIENILVSNFFWVKLQVDRILPFWIENMTIPVNPSILQIGVRRAYSAVEIYDKLNPSRYDALSHQKDLFSKAKKTIIDSDVKINLMVMGSERIDAPDETYDLVIDFFNLHHFENWPNMVSEISRVLKPDGYFVFGEVYYGAFREFFMRSFFGKKRVIQLKRKTFIKELGSNKLSLLEKSKNLGGHGIIGLSKKR